MIIDILRKLSSETALVKMTTSQDDSVKCLLSLWIRKSNISFCFEYTGIVFNNKYVIGIALLSIIIFHKKIIVN